MKKDKHPVRRAKMEKGHNDSCVMTNIVILTVYMISPLIIQTVETRKEIFGQNVIQTSHHLGGGGSQFTG